MPPHREDAESNVPDVYTTGVRYHRRLSTGERALTLRHTIDPGFVNHRLIQSVLGDKPTALINEGISRIPPMPDWQRAVQVDHVYKDVALAFCEAIGIRTLGDLVHDQQGTMFCSTEPWAPCPEVYSDRAGRLVSRWAPYGGADLAVELHYSAKHVLSDTLRMELSKGGELSVIAHLHRATQRTLIFHPLVIGNPWLRADDPELDTRAMWWGRNFYEQFIEDFEEFSQVRGMETPEDPGPMELISERAFKRALASILGDHVAADWGGETSDYSTAHLHLDGRRVTGAFLLKGPSRFAPMGLNHLGKNNDQIYRLAAEPADILFLQHSHDVLPAVRATLRAFAVQPSNPRRYCVIDGRDSLRLLHAYGLYERALEWTREH